VPEASKHWESSSPYQLMMNRVEWKYPMKRREFVALDIVHRDKMIFISKSSLSPKRPGGSRSLIILVHCTFLCVAIYLYFF
jgi:hypothetical protein